MITKLSIHQPTLEQHNENIYFLFTSDVLKSLNGNTNMLLTFTPAMNRKGFLSNV